MDAQVAGQLLELAGQLDHVRRDAGVGRDRLAGGVLAGADLP
jgi:hypothetical protein